MSFFSDQNSILKPGEDDVYLYDKFPQTLSNQLKTIWNRFFINWIEEEYFIKDLLEIFCIRRGDDFEYYQDKYRHKDSMLIAFITDKDESYKKKFFLTELFYKKLIEEDNTPSIQEHIKLLNDKLQANSIGYRFDYDSREFMRIDSELTHEEIIKPTLKFLTDSRFKNAETEFLTAHKYYRENNTACYREASRSLESTFKIIYKIKGWTCPNSITLSGLIDLGFKNNLFGERPYHRDFFDNLKAILKTLGTPGNKEGVHGAGDKIQKFSEELAGFTLNTVASAIIYAFKSFEKIQ